ncbi:MAG: hypothetical protein ACI9XJ_000913 [Marivirga sp.]|jgi:hypothetical protein
MKKSTYILFLIVFNSVALNAQYTSVDNYEGQWDDAGSWTTIVPNDFSIDEDIFYNIDGYISIGTPSVYQDLNFTNTGQNEDFTINDTLVVFGNVSHANRGHNIIIGSNAIFIVFGNFIADNKIDIESGGKFIVTGNLSFSPSAQDTYAGTGDLYVFGTTSNNADADAVDQDQTAFNANEDPELISFVNNAGTNGSLPIDLVLFNAKSVFSNIELNWVTAKEENFSHFEIERSVDQKNYEVTGIVVGLGESLAEANYEFTDNKAPYGQLYYRLKSVDNDGSFEYSPIVQVRKGLEGKMSVSPNPTKAIDQVKINLPAEFKGTLTKVTLYDINGLLIQQAFNVDANQPLKINNSIKAGMYIIKVQHNGLEKKMRLIIQ